MKKWLNFSRPVLNQRGIALLIVIATVAILVAAISDFMFDSHLAYKMAVNYKNRTQAYYLARSALSFSTIVLSLNKDAEKLITQAQSKGVDTGGIEPLYRMMPISSEMFRGIVAMAPGSQEAAEEESLQEDQEASTAEGEAEEETTDGTSPEESQEDASRNLGVLSRKELESFLEFDGDFAAEISENGTKIDLNAVYSLETSSTSYDLWKKAFLALLLTEPFKNLFDDQAKDAEEMVNHIADWVDKNETRDEIGGGSYGREQDLYPNYSVKNGKMFSASELHLVHGMTDALYRELEDRVTVEGLGSKINPCLAEEDMVQALIVSFTQANDCVSDLSLEDSDKLTELVGLLLMECPEKSAMASALNEALGLTQEEESELDTQCTPKFEDLVDTTNEIFTVIASGQVGDTTTEIHVVLDTSAQKPSDWPYHYWRVE